MATMGPVQLLVVGFDDPQFTGEIRAELERLRENDTIRLIDLALVRKDENGVVERLQQSDLSTEEAEELGAVIGALIGFGVADEEGAEAGAAAGAAGQPIRLYAVIRAFRRSYSSWLIAPCWRRSLSFAISSTGEVATCRM